MNLNFGMRGPQDMCNDGLFQFSKIFIFSLLGPFCRFLGPFCRFLGPILFFDINMACDISI